MIKDFKLKNYYNNIDNNHLYKGTSFRCNEWAPNTKYFNNQDYIDFVFKNNCLFMCVKNHVSNGLNEPITYDNGRTVLKDETYWKLVVAGEAQSELVIPDASSSNQVLTSDSQGSWSWKDLSQITLAKGKIESVENIEDTYVSIEPVSTLARSASSNMYVLNMGIYNGKDGKDGKDGNPGEPGKDGIQVQYIYKLSANPTIEWFETEAVQNDDHVPDGWSNKLLEVTGEYPYQFESTRIKRNGLWEVWLKPTLRNQLLETMPSRLTSFIFCRVPDLGDTYEIEVPSGGSYDNPIPSAHGKFTYLKNGQWTEYIPTWYDSVPSGKGNVWMTKATFSQFSTAKMIWDTPTLMADSESRQVEYVSEVSSEQLAGLYSISDSKYNFGLFDNNSYNSLEEREKAWRSFISYNLNINCYDASEMADQDAVYMLECTSVDKGFTWSDWKVIRIKGENGTNISPKGHLDSLPECNDTNYKLGDCVYVDGHMYIHNGDSICEDGSSCCWVDFGDVKGSHVHIKYAVKVDEGGEEVNIAGTNISLKFTDQNGDVPGDYVGTMVSDNEDPSIYMKDYKWTRWRGEDGWGYEYVFTGWYEKSTPEMVADEKGTKIDNSFIDSDEYQADGYRPYARKENSKDVYTYQRCEDDLPPLDAIENRYIWRATRKRVDGKWGAFSEFKLHSSWAQGVEQVVDYYAWSDASDYNGEIALSQFYVDKKFVEATITTDSSGNEFYWVLSDSKGSKSDGYVNQWLHNVTITLYDTGHSNITVTTLYKQAADGKAVKDIKSYYKLSEDNLLADTIRFNPDSWFSSVYNHIQNYKNESKQYVVAFDVAGGDYITINNIGLYRYTENDGISRINDILAFDFPITNLWITPSFIRALSDDIRGFCQLIQYVSKNNGFIFISDDNTIFPEVDLEVLNNSFPPSNKLKLYTNVAPNKLTTSTKHWSLIVTPESLYNDYCTYDWSTDTNLSVDVDYPYLFEKVATTISDNITTETIWSPPHIISTYQSPGYATYKFLASRTPLVEAPTEDEIVDWSDGPYAPRMGEVLYVTSKMIYDDDKERDKTWSKPKALVDSNVFQVEYSSDYDGRSTLPNFTEFLGHDAAEKEWRNKAKTDNCGTWTDNPDNAVYMATCQISGQTAADWVVMKVKGEDGTGIEIQLNEYTTLDALQAAFAERVANESLRDWKQGYAWIIDYAWLYIFSGHWDVAFSTAFSTIEYKGEDGHGNETIYKLGAYNEDGINCPSPTIDNVDINVWNAEGYVPNGWSDTPLSVTPTDPCCYVAIRKYPANNVDSDGYNLFHGPRIGKDEYSKKASLYSKWAYNGSDVLRLDLSNQNISINCDKDGNFEGINATCKATLYEGATKISKSVKYYTSNESVTIDTEGNLNFEGLKSFDEDSLDVEISAKYIYSDTYTSTLRLIKQYPGSDGAPAISYWLVPSSNSIVIDKNGNATPDKITVSAMQQIGNDAPTQFNGTIKYQLDQGEENVYSTPITCTSVKDNHSIIFKLYNNDTVVDIETIPILKDGKDGEDGESAPMVYDAGEWKQDVTYEVTSTVVPCVYVLSKDGKIRQYYKALQGNTGFNPASNSNYWEKLSSTSALYTSVLFADCARVGEVVFYGDWMYSQKGTGSEYQNFNKEAKTVQEVLSSNTDDTGDTGKTWFIPSFAINCKTGDGYFASGNLIFDVNSVGTLNLHRKLKLDNGYIAGYTYSPNSELPDLKRTDIYYMLQSGIYLPRRVYQGGVGPNIYIYPPNGSIEFEDYMYIFDVYIAESFNYFDWISETWLRSEAIDPITRIYFNPAFGNDNKLIIDSVEIKTGEGDVKQIEIVRGTYHFV